MNKENKKVIITTSWDDGYELDLKLAKLLRKYKIAATFYIPLHSPKQKIISNTKINELDKFFEIGCHTHNHVNLTQVSIGQAKNEILIGKKGLEKILQHKIIAFCYPFGLYNKKIVSIVRDLNFTTARCVKLFSTKFIKNKFEIGTTIHASNYSLLVYIKQALSNNILLFLNLLVKGTLNDWGAMSKESLKYVVKHGGIWHLQGHSWEIEKNNDWNKLENVFKHIKQVKNQYPYIYILNNSQLANIHK